MFSFVDCPWCLAAKRLLQEDLALDNHELLVLELEDLGRRGKHLRAALALTTGRTSLPAVFVGGCSVGGFTDGFDEISFLGEYDCCWEASPGLQELHVCGKLQQMIADARDTPSRYRQ